MQNSSLITILKTFSQKEIKSFGRFVRSPYFNTSEATAALFSELKRYYPEFSSPEIEKQAIFKKIYGSQNYSEELTRKLTSNLIKLAEEFITQQKLEQLKPYKDNFMLDGYLDRKLASLYKKKYDAVLKEFNANNKIDENYYLIAHKLNVSRIYYYLMVNDLDAYSKQYEITADKFTLGFLNFLFKAAAQLVGLEKIVNYRAENALVTKFMKSFDFEVFFASGFAADETEIMIVKLYYHNYMMLVEPENEEHYHLYKSLFIASSAAISRGENFNLLLNLEAYCALKINHGNEKFFDEIMDVYEKMFEMNIYSFNENEPLPQMQFRNILLCAMRGYEASSFKDIAHLTLSKIDKEAQPLNSIYVNALYAFKQKDFGECLKQLAKIDPVYFGFKTDYRNFQLMCYYELGEIETALSVIDSYKHFLAGNESLSGIFREGNTNFIKFIGELIRLKAEPDEFRLNKLEKTIAGTLNVFNKWWLTAKIREF